jgi:hypothetical protein
MKFSTCERQICGKKYENRHECVGKIEGIRCTCLCRIPKALNITATTASVGLGITVAAGGLTLSILTGGIFAAVGGGAMVKAGTSLIMNPIQRRKAGERMSVRSSMKGLVAGSAISKFVEDFHGGFTTISVCRCAD